MTETICYGCNHTNPEGSNFCNRCGAVLASDSPYPAWILFDWLNNKWCPKDHIFEPLEDFIASLTGRQFGMATAFGIAHVTNMELGPIEPGRPGQTVTYTLDVWRPLTRNADGSFTLEEEPADAPRVIVTDTLE